MSVSAPLVDCQWFDTFVSRCQIFIGRAIDTAPAELVALFRHLADDIPAETSLQQRLAIHYVLGRLVAGFGRLDLAGGNAELARALLQWSAANLTAADWHVQLKDLVAHCALGLEHVSEARAVRPSARCAARLLRTIDERCTDPQLTIETVASESGASVRQAARVLKGETGQTFLAHLHHARVAAACHVLRRSTISIKETAVTVGYVSSSEFGKHFKRLVGMTPATFRLRLGHASVDGRNAR